MPNKDNGLRRTENLNYPCFLQMTLYKKHLTGINIEVSYICVCLRWVIITDSTWREDRKSSPQYLAIIMGSSTGGGGAAEENGEETQKPWLTTAVQRHTAMDPALLLAADRHEQGRAADLFLPRRCL